MIHLSSVSVGEILLPTLSKQKSEGPSSVCYWQVGSIIATPSDVQSTAPKKAQGDIVKGSCY